MSQKLDESNQNMSRVVAMQALETENKMERYTVSKIEITQTELENVMESHMHSLKVQMQLTFDR